MLKRLTAVLILCATQHAFASDCPVTDFDEKYMTNVIDAVEKATSCYEAADIAESCAMGSSMDVAITQPAIKICAADFSTELGKNANDLNAYNKLQDRCEQKYRNMQGTMYRSAAAFCTLDINRLYSLLYTVAE